jgi:hypothetical protein
MRAAADVRDNSVFRTFRTTASRIDDRRPMGAATKEIWMTQFAAGDRVAHGQYGDGTVISVNEYHTIIDFDAHGLRTFSSPRVQLAAATSVAPVKPPTRRRRATTPKN